MMKASKKRIIGGFAAAGCILGMTSSAFACTRYIGALTATNASGSTTTQGNNVQAGGMGMSWCNADPGAVLTDNAGVSNTISLNYGPGTCNGVLGRPASGGYKVGYAAGYMGQGGQPHINCHQTASNFLGNMSVNPTTRTGSGTYTYTAAAAGVGTNICVYSNHVADAGDINISTI